MVRNARLNRAKQELGAQRRQSWGYGKVIEIRVDTMIAEN
jgi:hypothetical protein